MTVAFQHLFGILERWNNNQVTPSLSKPHELSYRSNTYAVNKNIIGNSEGDIGKSIEKLDGNYLETMEKLNIIDTRVRGIFHVVSLIFNAFLH